ncbi:unnamed protein product [Urochloa humidicola]
MHVALLARGEEPLTYVWLLLAHLKFFNGRRMVSGLSWYRSIDRNSDFINTGIPQAPMLKTIERVSTLEEEL